MWYICELNDICGVFLELFFIGLLDEIVDV